MNGELKFFTPDRKFFTPALKGETFLRFISYFGGGSRRRKLSLDLGIKLVGDTKSIKKMNMDLC